MSTVIEDFPAMKEAVAAMRALLEGASEDLVFESMLVARELITNALRYGGGRAYFTYDVEKGYLRIAVRSENGFRPPAEVPRASVDAESGRGLFLVDSLSEKRDYDEKLGIRVFIRIHK